jgi:hypothetical protein
MDILEHYTTLKKANGVKLTRYADGTYRAEVRTFNALTGAEQPTVIGNFNRQQAENERDTLKTRLALIEEFLADLDALPVFGEQQA